MPARYRCAACGNLTRFDVTATRRTKAFHHYSVGGDLVVEAEEVLEERVEDVSCRWCGRGDAVEVLDGVTADEPAPGLDLTGPEADELLRPAVELAIEMARAGLRQQPPAEVPARLRPVLGHAKLTRAAQATVRRVVEDDPGFRSRVVPAVELPGTDELVGRAGVLWLSRPEGWEAELGLLVEQARSAASARAEGAEERSASRRLRHAEEARARAEQAADEARRAAGLARGEVLEERRLRRAADEAAERAARHAASLEQQLNAARRAVEAAAARLTEKAEREDAALAGLAAAEAEANGLRAQVAARAAAPAEPATAVPPAEPTPEAGPGPDHDRRALGEAVAAASAAAAALGRALARAAAALEPERAPVGGEAPPDDRAALGSGPRAATRPRWARPQRRGTSRRPWPLPPLVHDDSAEAAAHLMSLPEVALLVDGYNATLATWPGLPLPEQRLRLVDALAELAARTGARPEVVFDGADVVSDLAPSRSVRSLVKVSFTEPDVEADDVLIARAHHLPLPVVVASDDHRVREGARRAGANVLGIQQLLTALRRQGPGGS